MNLLEELKKGKVTIGTERTLKALKSGNAKEVFLARNCPDSVRSQIEKYCKLLEIKLNILDQDSEQLGSTCKKPFPINSCYC